MTKTPHAGDTTSEQRTLTPPPSGTDRAQYSSINSDRRVHMKRMLVVLAIFTFIIPAVANAQSLNIGNIRTGNNPALAQIVSSVIASLRGVPQNQYQNQFSRPQVRRGFAPGPSVAYQNGYAQGLADARNAARYTQYGVNNTWYPQNFGNQTNRFQRPARGSWRDGY
jgi:hypothetical protein